VEKTIQQNTATSTRTNESASCDHLPDNQTNHRWNKTVLDKLCNVSQEKLGVWFVFIKDLLCILSLPFCAVKAPTLLQNYVKDDGRNT